MGVSKRRKEMGKVEGGRRTKRRDTAGKKKARQWKPFHANVARDRARHLQRSSKPKQVRTRDVTASSRRPPCVCIITPHRTESITTPPSHVHDRPPQPQRARTSSSSLAQSRHTKVALRRRNEIGTETHARNGKDVRIHQTRRNQKVKNGEKARVEGVGW